MKIVLIGQGNVATSLHAAFTAKHIDVQMVSSRTGLDCLPSADCYIYSVKDDALAQVIQQVHTDKRCMHLHTSGTMPLSVFGEDKPHCGIFYPFMTFTKAKPIADFSAIPIFFQANHIDDVAAIYSLALQLTSYVYEATQHDRERLHIAGVYCNNFANLMYRLAAEQLKDTHIPFSALLPLIDETAQKVHTLSPQEAQTGPARRGDEQVINHHLSLLATDADRELYKALSRRIQDGII
ncbi:MAG: DUF2520 domain-containing protein [Paludibacteraceae bacterium]|nr:DUF2520 domain-containing protein [Paludibacteraceae bacterium]